jgi:phenylpropionate dioxygenase-like ring-hydroxylating dioxygenase large terminal subunit
MERGGVIWIYMGPKELKPAFPELEWTKVPENQRIVVKMFIDGNYLQTMEGDIDNSHVGFLHSTFGSERPAQGVWVKGQSRPYVTREKAPIWTIKDTDGGVMLAARRNAEEDSYHWRVGQWLMPSYALLGAIPGEANQCNIRVPLDDEHTLYFRLWFCPDRPLSEAEVAEVKVGGVIFPHLIPGTFLPVENEENNYLIDRAAQRNYSFTGIKSVPAQDFAVQADQGGRIMDRSLENAVSGDRAIIQMRQRLMRSARALQEGQEPPEAHNGDVYRVRGIDIVLPKNVPLEEGVKQYMPNQA